MAMTLRLSDEEASALRRRAEAEQRSMQEVARAAVREYVERHDHDDDVDRAAAWVTTNFREALDRLGRA
jgi:predicted transcriptional regulator